MAEAAPGPAPESAVPEDGVPEELPRRQVNIIFVTILFGILLAALDQTIVATALPTIVGDLGGASHLSWVVTAYILAQTVATALAGKFGDLFGRNRVFRVSVAVFIAGSFLCGLSTSMGLLIAFRAIQGIGAGGLMVTAIALIAEVVPLRDRGRYQGAIGGVFGATTVIGPLLGGLFTDYLSWRWAFYVNVPIAAGVLVVAARTLPRNRALARPVIDYAGVVWIALTATTLTLATSWGGSEYAWGSPVILGLLAVAAVSLVAFVLVERRAAEPVIPLHLFGRRVFTVAALLSFIVGFALVGSMTFLPTYLQYVVGASATLSGLQTLPMVVGLLVTSISAGSVVGRTGRYRIFPIVGSVLMTLGLFLLARMGPDTPLLVRSLSMLVLGAGIGFSMQLLTLVVQNTVDYRDLGTATSGVTFFRTLGSSFGASILGGIYAGALDDRLPGAVAASGAPAAAAASPQALWELAEAVRRPVVEAYADALQVAFLAAVPVGILAFGFALALPQVTMRGTARAAAGDTGDGFAMPRGQRSEERLEDAVSRLLTERREGAPAQALELSGSSLDRATVWGLFNVYLQGTYLDRTPSQAALERRVGLPPGVLTSYVDELVAAGWLRRVDGDTLALTDAGEAEVAVVRAGWISWLVRELGEWLPPDAVESPTDESATPAAEVPAVRERVQEVLPPIVARIIREDYARADPTLVTTP